MAWNRITKGDIIAYPSARGAMIFRLRSARKNQPASERASGSACTVGALLAGFPAPWKKIPCCQVTCAISHSSMAGAVGCLPACRFGVLVQFCAFVCLLVRGYSCLRARPCRPHALKEGVRFCVGVDNRLRIRRFFQKRCADVKFRVKQSGISPVGENFAGNFITCLRQRLRGGCCCWRCYSTMGAALKPAWLPKGARMQECKGLGNGCILGCSVAPRMQGFPSLLHPCILALLCAGSECAVGGAGGRVAFGRRFCPAFSCHRPSFS